MALSYSALGRVDQPPNLVGASGTSDLALRVADITLGTVSTDYVVGTGVALVASALGVNAIMHVVGASIRSSANAHRNMVGIWDQNLNGVRLYQPGTATVGDNSHTVLAEITTGQLGAGDILRLAYIGV